MHLQHLATFRVVAASLSFTHAAEQLGYVQSAVTMHIKALEDELGVRLFDRLGRSIAMTDAGVRLVDYADRILLLDREAVTEVGGAREPRGPVRVSAPEVLCAYRLPAVLKALHRRHPNVRLCFRANPTGALDADVREGFARGEIDAAFVLGEDLESTGAHVIEVLTQEPLVVVAPPEHPLARASGVSPEDLDGVPVLLTDKGCGYRRVFQRALDQAGARLVVAGEFTSGETVKRCVEAGTGIGVLAAVSVAAEVKARSLVVLGWTGPRLALTSYLVRHKERWVSPAHAALRDAAHAVFGRDDRGALEPARSRIA